MNFEKKIEQLPDENQFKEKVPTELIRPVRISATPGTNLDKKFIDYRLYNSFNYSLLLPNEYKPLNLSLGVTSPHQGEGKTTALCNLATAVSLGLGRKTVIVDMSATYPRLDKIFGIPKGPGVSEALQGGEICVVPTQIENLYAMPAGYMKTLANVYSHTFRAVLSSLMMEFEFVLIDMPHVLADDFPTLIANHLTGLVVVIKSGKTKRRDLNKLFRRVHRNKVQAFVMNEVRESDFQ